MTKKLLILTQYFPPEVGAPQNRLFELAVRLQSKGMDVTILTAMPNYPEGEVQEAYQGMTYHFEEMSGLKVHRASIYTTKSKKILPRLRNYFSFVYSSWKIGRKRLEKDYDYLLCESPPLFLSYSARRLSRRFKARFVFNVSDLWPESAEKLGLVTNRLMLRMAKNLEERTYRKADLITGQTQGICNDIKSRFPNKEVYWLPNGVDLSYYDPNQKLTRNWREENGFSADDVLFFYGGIIGHAQGLEVILKAAQIVQSNKAKFILMGAGPCKPDLLKMAKELELANVHFFDPVGKKDMPDVVASIDVSLVPLRKLDLFLGAIPSKIFEALAMEKALLLGVDGEARQLFIEQGRSGLYFEPENHQELASSAVQLAENAAARKEFGKNGRMFVDKNFNRNDIAQRFFEQLSKL